MPRGRATSSSGSRDASPIDRPRTAKKGSDGARRPLVSGNWKMNQDHLQALHTVQDLGLRLRSEDVAILDVSVHPPFTDLRTVQLVVEGDSIPVLLGAQHCSNHESGAYTGEVSAGMLARLGTQYVIVGHSERRSHFDMNDETVASTLRAVLGHGMTPICCVGETAEERDAGRTEGRIEAQVRSALEGLSPEQLASLVIAYEPIWAIGAGQPATPVNAEDACNFIRQLVAELGDKDAAQGVRIQYGGSVDPENAGDLVREPNVDGLLVGGASLSAPTFVDVIRSVGACYRSLAA